MLNSLPSLNDFSGTARLFPLPNIVFFPQAVQALHIFEPRYRAMMADALADDRLLAMVLLQPGWEHTYDHRPAIAPVACLGRIVADELLPDGRYNLILRGMWRIRIDAELPPDKPYRLARVTPLVDNSPAPLERRQQLRKQLADLVLNRFGDGPVGRQLQELFAGEEPLGVVVDLLMFALPLPPAWKQEMLQECDETIRTERLIGEFAHLAPVDVPLTARPFPPKFSCN